MKHRSLTGGASDDYNARVPALKDTIGETTKIACNSKIKALLEFLDKSHAIIIAHIDFL